MKLTFAAHFVRLAPKVKTPALARQSRHFCPENLAGAGVLVFSLGQLGFRGRWFPVMAVCEAHRFSYFFIY